MFFIVINLNSKQRMTNLINKTFYIPCHTVSRRCGKMSHTTRFEETTSSSGVFTNICEVEHIKLHFRIAETVHNTNKHLVQSNLKHIKFTIITRVGLS